ncbi:MAG TPA: serine hydrolase [Thermoanaerobaculia bacterium]|nr:serine hydrolase [Thermoanaerobaculia bacterium]
MPRLIPFLVLVLFASRGGADPAIGRLMREGDVAGLSIVVIRGGTIVSEKAYGVANAETRAPLTRRAIFESASLGKPVFAYAVLRLVDAGVLSLDVPLQHYLAEPVSDERMKQITARMVLAHTTGFQNEVMPGQTLAVHFTPGSRFSYSGAGFLYLERVIEHLTGKELPVLMRELVFTPLGMRDSGYVWIPEFETRKVFGHRASGRVAERRRPAVATVATLHTTPADFARFMIATMKGTGLKPATARAMLTGQSAVDESCSNCLKPGSGKISTALSWGLGWGIQRTAWRTAFWHWGENNGEVQNFAIGDRKGDGVVVFTNSGNGFSIMPEVIAAVLPGEYPAFAWMGYERYDSPAKTVFRDIRVHGVLSPAIDKLTEAEINRLGYLLLDTGRIADAVRIFERNVKRFPGSGNVYDSLGEAYAAAGEREKAIGAYERALTLDPANTHAVEMLQKLRAGR